MNPVLLQAQSRQQVMGSLHFPYGISGKRDPDGIPDAVAQQCAKGRCGFEDPHPFGAGFGHAKVQRTIGLGSKQAAGFHRCHGVAGFDGNKVILKMRLFQQADIVQGRFHQRFGRRAAVSGKNLFF